MIGIKNGFLELSGLKSFFIAFLFWTLFLIVTLIQVKHRTQIDDYLMRGLLVYGVVFNGWLIALKPDKFSVKKLLVLIAVGSIFLVFYIAFFLLTYVLFRVPKGPFVQWQFETLLPVSPWPWTGSVLLLSLLLGLIFFICHEILWINKLKHHFILFFFHFISISLLGLLFYGFGILLFYEQGEINIGKQVMLGCATLMVSFVHLVGVLKMNAFVIK